MRGLYCVIAGRIWTINHSEVGFNNDHYIKPFKKIVESLASYRSLIHANIWIEAVGHLTLGAGAPTPLCSED